MRFACLGYLDTARWAELTEEQRQNQINDCIQYDQVLEAGGHAAGGGCLGDSSAARTLRKHHDEVRVTDGPYIETKEMLGGILYLEARDMDQAVELISRHPGLAMGPFEVRPMTLPPGPQPPTPEQEIRTVITRWSRALESKNVDAMMADYAEDAVLFDAIPPYKVVGREAIAQAWRHCLPYFPESFRSEHRDLTIQVAGDLALVFGIHHFVVEPADHPAGQTWMRISVALRKLLGKWKVIHEHISIPFNPMDDRSWKITDPDQLTAPDYSTCK